MKVSKRKEIENQVLYNSLVGKYVKVVDSTNSKTIGIEGYLVYESANLFFILTKDEKKVKLFKNTVTLEVELGGKLLNINGSLLLSTISNRIKKMK